MNYKLKKEIVGTMKNVECIYSIFKRNYFKIPFVVIEHDDVCLSFS